MIKSIAEIQLQDGSSTGITIFSMKKTTEKTAVILLFPAMGVAASYYESFAGRLCGKKAIVITADLRGQGMSSVRPSRKTNFGYHEMLELDYDGILEKVRDLYPKNPLYLFGHSLGGQLSCLYLSKSNPDCRGLILVACCSVYYRGWDGFDRVKTLIFSQVFGLIAGLLGYFPGDKIGFGGVGAKNQLKDWSQQARSGQYLPLNSLFDYEEALSEMNVPVFAVSFKTDKFAPKKAVQLLLGKFSGEADIRHHHVSAQDLGLERVSHFSWAKAPGNLIRKISEWV